MSAESGIKTFRDADGLWEGHDVMEVASPEGWYQNQELVLDFYNQRRKQLKEVKPNLGHLVLTHLERMYDTVIITQNVDDLHERAGSSKIIHLHGELRKARSTVDPHLILDWSDDLVIGDYGEDGHQLRPHIVWFGEQVPMMDSAIAEVRDADIVIIIGTSMQVYPAAGLVAYARDIAEIYYIDPRPHVSPKLAARNLNIITEVATTGLKKLVDALMIEPQKRHQ